MLMKHGTIMNDFCNVTLLWTFILFIVSNKTDIKRLQILVFFNSLVCYNNNIYKISLN